MKDLNTEKAELLSPRNLMIYFSSFLADEEWGKIKKIN